MKSRSIRGESGRVCSMRKPSGSAVVSAGFSKTSRSNLSAICLICSSKYVFVLGLVLLVQLCFSPRTLCNGEFFGSSGRWGTATAVPRSSSCRPWQPDPALVLADAWRDGLLFCPTGGLHFCSVDVDARLLLCCQALFQNPTGRRSGEGIVCVTDTYIMLISSNWLQYSGVDFAERIRWQAS